MESKDNSSSNDEQTSSSQFCQEVGSANSINSIMDNASSVNGNNNGDCPKCSICKKRLARKSKYIVSECMEVYISICSVFCAHDVSFFFNGASFHISRLTYTYVYPVLQY